MKCFKCNIEMQADQVTFNYLGYTFQSEIPCCPECGQVYVPEELAEGRMQQVEIELEDK